MFFKQVWRNAARNRRGNGLFFGSLVIAIVAFYTLLSLGQQDVMRFLATMESDAVRKLLMMLPVVYILSLFFVFFLVYFACKYQMDSRRREFGMYLMMGMRRGRLFLMLFFETLWNSLVSLLIGLPVALFLTEGISLGTASLVGLGILGHQLSLSTGALVWTVCGFVLVQLLAMLIICVPLGRTEPAKLLQSGAAEKQVEMSKAGSTVFFLLGIALLLTAYYLGIFSMRNLQIVTLLGIFVSGIMGTFFLYRGLGGFLGKRIRRKSPDAMGLATFTGRQIQENVLGQHKALAVSSLLLLMGISCLSYGISVGIGMTTDSRSTDFSLFGEEKQVETALESEAVRRMVKAVYPMYLSMSDASYDDGAFASVLRTIDGGEHIADGMHWGYVIQQSAYNRMLSAMGKEELSLDDHSVALFSSIDREGDFLTILDKAVKKGASIGINGKEFAFVPYLCYDNIVADRAITLYTALIVPDELFAEIARDTEPYCWNVHLTDSAVREMGLMQAIQEMDGYLAESGLEYDSYLAGIGRNLFYAVASSYLTIYLGILFLLIANTVIGLKYLIQLRRNQHRYQTLYLLGADTEGMCRSVNRQVGSFFSLVLSVAVVSGVAAVITMFSSFTRLPIGTSMASVAGLAAAALLAVALLEVLYIRTVKRMACREIRALENADRE